MIKGSFKKINELFRINEAMYGDILLTLFNVVNFVFL